MKEIMQNDGKALYCYSFDSLEGVVAAAIDVVTEGVDSDNSKNNGDRSVIFP